VRGAAWLVGLVALAFAIAGHPLLFEEQLVFFPSRELVGSPASFGLDYEDVCFGPDGRLHGWLLPGSGHSTLLWLHGNAGNVSSRLPWLARLRAATSAHLFIFDYQGYGLSSGKPSEAATYADARDSLAFLRQRPEIDMARIVYYGESLGGAVGTQLALEAPPAGLVLQSSFTSVADLARIYYPLIPPGLIRTRYATVDKLGQVAAPIVIVHGEQDEIVPVEQAHRLYAAANEPKRLHLVPGASHNDLIDRADATYFELLRELLAAPGR
jgi:fermentation-respiration switch protein FrsA (DUF1100 family)